MRSWQRLAHAACEQWNVVGVDLAMESVEKARVGYPALRFEQLDIFEEGAAAALQKLAPAGFGRVFVDINGSRMLPAVLAALRFAVEELGTPVVVVKSRALHAHLGQAEEPQKYDCSRAS